MKRAHFLAPACFALLLHAAPAVAAPEKGTSSLIVRFDHSAVSLAPGATAASLDALDIRTPGLRHALLMSGAKSASRLFPSFRPGDVRGFNALGEEVLLDDLSDFYIVKVQRGAAPVAAQRLKGARGVLVAHPPRVGSTNAAPNDPLFGDQWYLNNTPPNCVPGSLADVDLNLPEARDILPGASPSVRLGIIDTGVLATHADLSGSVDPATNFASAFPCECINLQDPGPECDLDCGDPPGPSTLPEGDHGTRVAGVAAAISNNALGVAGVASGAKVVPYKVLNFGGGPLSCWLAQAIDAARTQSVPVTNMSVRVSQPDAGLTAAVRNAFYSGMLMVVAIGNAGSPLKEYPAGFANMVCAVGAVDANGKRWTSSTYGSWIDLCAAGGNHVATTTALVNANCTVGGGAYLDCDPGTSGTSFTAPVVTGLAGLLLSKYPGDSLVGEDLQQIMSRTAVDVVGDDPKFGYYCTAGWDSLTGWGYVRADAALNFLAPPVRLDHTQVAGLLDTMVTTTTVTFMNMPNPSMNGAHTVRRHLLRRQVTFFPDYYTGPTIWMRSSGTIGVKDTATFDYDTEVYSGRVAAGSLSASGCTVETVVYEVLDSNNALIGWFPSQPAGARVAFTTVGVPDTTPPANTTDLAVDAVSRNSIVVTWTAPGDDGDTGTATAYDLRRSLSPITPANFASATPVATSAPMPAGSGEQAVATGLSACRWYYFALKTRDQSGNWSAISNLASGRTSCSGGGALASEEAIPEVAALQVTSANPAAIATSLQFSVPSSAGGASLDLSVFDVTGRRIRTLEHGAAAPGVHALTWDLRSDGGSKAGAGVYFVRLTVAGTRITRRVVVSREDR